MEFLARVDYFRKVPPKHKRSSTFGGILSLISITIIILLLVSEVYDYWLTPRVLKKAEVINDFDVGYVDLSLDVIFEHAPCSGKCV